MKNRENALNSIVQLVRVFSPVALLFVGALAAYRSLIFSDPGGNADLNAVENFTFEPTGGSPVLILTLTAWLLYRRLPRIPAGATSTGSTVTAIGLLAVACAGCLWSHYVSLPQIQTLALCVMIFGFGVFLGGAKGARAVRVPGFFVLLAYTPPGVLINQIVYPLQIGTAEATTAILGAVGISALQMNDLVLARGSVFQVIETCSGLRTTPTLLMSSVLYAELFHRKRGRALVLVLIAPVLGILVNQLRVLSIVLNPYARDEVVHTAQGLAMIVVGVLGLAAVDWIAGWVASRRPAPARRPRPAAQKAQRAGALVPPLAWSPRVAALVVMLAAISLAPLMIPSWKAPSPKQMLLSSLPANLDGWQAKGLPIDSQFLGSVRFSSWVHRRYEKGDDSVEVFIAADEHLDPRFSLISPKTEILRPGHRLERLGTVDLPDDSQVAQAVATFAREGTALAFHWYPMRQSLSEELVRAMFGLDRSPFRRPSRSEVIRLSTPLAEADIGTAAATARLRNFARILSDKLG